MDLDPPGMGSYSTLIVTMGLSSTVNPQCTPRQTDGRTDILLTIAQPMLCIGGLIKLKGGLMIFNTVFSFEDHILIKNLV